MLLIYDMIVIGIKSVIILCVFLYLFDNKNVHNVYEIIIISIENIDDISLVNF